MTGPSRQPPQRGRMRLLWIGNLVLAVIFLLLALTADSRFSRILGLALAALTLAMAWAWFRQERITGRTAG